LSSLTDIEKRYLETLFEMDTGYVLDFTDRTFYDFIQNITGVDIHAIKYKIYGSSKAKKLRAFWQTESDVANGRVLKNLLEHYKFNVDSGRVKFNEKIYSECVKITNRLLGVKNTINSEDELLKIKFGDINIKDLSLDFGLEKVLEHRMLEIDKCLGIGAYMSAIILCGSVLECLLLSYMLKNPKQFNTYNQSPKDKTGKVKPFQDWKLSEMIDVSGGIELLSQDTKKFSHELKNFRNYIHPMEQLANNFKPDDQTAKVAFQVLKMAILDLKKQRDTKLQ
jgi:hypothetical protein maviaA2_03477